MIIITTLCNCIPVTVVSLRCNSVSADLDVRLFQSSHLVNVMTTLCIANLFAYSSHYNN